MVSILQMRKVRLKGPQRITPPPTAASELGVELGFNQLVNQLIT